MKKETYKILGMSCTICSSSIQSTLSNTPGVYKVLVSLLNEQMTIEYDEKIITENSIFSLVEKLGYKIEVFDKDNSNINIESSKYHEFKIRFIWSIIFLIPLLYLSMGHMLMLPLPNFLDPKINPKIFSLLQLILTIPILFLNRSFFIKGFKALISLRPNMDSLVALGSTASFLYSSVITILIFTQSLSNSYNLAMNLFFESSAMILTLVTLGKWLENKAKRQTGKEIEKLGKYIPTTINIERDGQEVTINTSDLQIGDIVVIKQDEYIPIDGIVISGHGFIDKKAITGESIPVEVGPNDYVTSATINKNGFLKIKVNKIKDDTVIAKIIKMVQEAGTSKAPIEKLADKISLYFVPIVCLLSIITFIIWLIIADFPSAINMGVSVLVISCPCALGLATPVAVMVATGKSASLGILFKDAESLQKCNMIKKIMFDKTGTLTKGNLNVTDYITFIDDSLINDTIYSIEKMSNHPIAKCITEYLEKEKEIHSSLNVKDFKYLTGMGAVGTINNKEILIGNITLLKKYGIDISEEIKNEYINKFSGKTIIFIASDRLMAIISISDVLKESSYEAIKNLQTRNIEISMITGDNIDSANHIATKLNIEKVYANVLPADKLNIVKESKQDNQYSHLTAFIGDGINDSPALKEADVGIALAQGTDISIDCADVIIANENLDSINVMIDLSKKTLNIIKGNLFWAFFYNIIAIPISAGALSFIGIKLNPMIAAASMSLSSLFVVVNALRLKNYKYRKDIKMETQLTKEIFIEGMMCMHCAGRVEKALTALEEISNVTVLLKNKKAIVSLSKEISDEKLTKAITDTGYKVTNIK